MLRTGEHVGAGCQLSITNQCDDGPPAPSDLGLASDSSLQPAFDHLPLPPSLYLEMLESFPDQYRQKGHFYFQNIQRN